MTTAYSLALTELAGFNTLLPLTFPIESKSRSERLARQGMVLQSKISSPAVFLGFMATVAAHRAILLGYYNDILPPERNHDEFITDPDSQKIKHEAIVAVRQIIQNRQRADQYLIDACFGLVPTSTVTGNFGEARLHLHGIVQMIASVGTCEEPISWFPVTNMNVSATMITRPSLIIPWIREEISEKILQRIFPRSDTN